jgi:HEAT repeat protein
MTTLRDELRDTRTELLLWHLMKDRDPVMQRRIAFELGRRKAREATGHLQGLLEKSPDVRTRAAAAEALGEIGDEAAGEDLVNVFSDDTQPAELRDTCAYALARLGYEPALGRLFRGLLDPAPSVRRCALSAIASIGGEAELELIGMQAELEPDQELKLEMQTISAGHRTLFSFSAAALPSLSGQESANRSPQSVPLPGLLFTSKAQAA